MFFFFFKKALFLSLGGSSTTSTCARGHSARQVVSFIVLYIYLSQCYLSIYSFFPSHRWVNARVDLLFTFYQHFLQAFSSARQRCCPPSSESFFVSERDDDVASMDRHAVSWKPPIRSLAWLAARSAWGTVCSAGPMERAERSRCWRRRRHARALLVVKKRRQGGTCSLLLAGCDGSDDN